MFAIDSVRSLVLEYGLLIAIVLVLLGQVGVPIGAPAELVLLLAGGYAVRSVAGLIAGVLFVGVADVLGALVLFLLVRRGTTRLAVRFAGGRHGGRSWLDDRLRRRGPIFVVRVLPLMRIYGTIGAGIHRAKTRDFLAGSAPAGFLWTGAPLAVGYVLREHVSAVVRHYPTGMLSIAAAAPGLLLTALICWRSRRRAAGTASHVAPAVQPAARRVVNKPVTWLAERSAGAAPALQPRPVVAAGARPLSGPPRSVRPHP
jgi:membrane protein DedA with SNARE-associated domain